ncbi:MULTISPECIES: TetR/AcrR family transcriptional regulator [Deinococcus]|uniref:TetR/AcrR family transcriptional regulator n=1 Tax=Deinococcus rufus TaxID=2136097 RepID=A0ABV7ZEW9_9DEIO|nr:TetR/AcrR family transcriptional regulator [Deinococcus sp. AB2017081]WQE93669.1 TetR/AcrR family transcriptional regulator [Deinococcus sp. AB2017081]
MPRPRKFRDADVIAAARETFTQQGFGGTTLDDLTTATGLGKQSLYNAFGGKRELYLRALTDSAAEAVTVVDAALNHSGATPLERIRAHLLKLAIAFSGTNSEADLLTKATVERAGHDSEVAHSALHTFERLEQSYRQCIVDAQEHGEIPPGSDPDALAALFLALTRGMEVLGSAGVGRVQLTAVAMTSLDLVATADSGTVQP